MPASRIEDSRRALTIRMRDLGDYRERGADRAEMAALESVDVIDCWLFSDAVHEPVSDEDFAAILSPVEVARWREMTDPERARQFALSRRRLRFILGGYLGQPAAAISLTFNENGKPELPGGELEFNLSHTRGWLGIAVSRTRPLGLDLERRREVLRIEKIARKFFTPTEVALLEARQGEDRLALFFKLWSAKEALIKGMGGGVFKHVLQTQLSLSATGDLQAESLPGARAAEWHLHTLRVEPEVTGMLAVGPDP